MLPTLLHDPGFSLTISQQGIHTRGYSSPGLVDYKALTGLSLLRVDYKALTGLSLLRVPHLRARREASLKDLYSDTMSVSKAKCFPVSR
jgi:hypothetical protein